MPPGGAPRLAGVWIGWPDVRLCCDRCCHGSRAYWARPVIFLNNGMTSAIGTSSLTVTVALASVPAVMATPGALPDDQTNGLSLPSARTRRTRSAYGGPSAVN